MKKNFIIFAFIFNVIASFAKTYYISPVMGNDLNNGTSKELPFKTLNKLENIRFMPGDSILLHTEGVHHGIVKLIDVCGDESSPIVVSAYDTFKGRRRVAEVDAGRYVAGIYMENCSYVNVSRIKITANGEIPDDFTIKKGMRCGVLVEVTSNGNYGNISLEQLHIENIFFNPIGMERSKREVKTANGTEAYGWGIRFINKAKDSIMDNIYVSHCTIENVAHTGIKITGKGHNIKNFRLAYNTVTKTGGPGIQISGSEEGHIYNNDVSYSGAEDDIRKWGRGSGLWTWGTKDVIIEKNRFMYANGPGDSAGAHIDYNCSNIIIQYNLSVYNAGGFCEILGNNYNCVYRYNISINDGFRVKGQGGAFQEGKTLWTSGYVGRAKPMGPFNSYIYNNTIYADKGICSRMTIGNTTDGLWIANNIIYLKGGIKTVLGDQYRKEKKGESIAKGVIVCNNLFKSVDEWNKIVKYISKKSISGNPCFRNESSLCPEDYVPLNLDIIKDKGIIIPLSGNISQVDKDFFGNAINGIPDLGAIECK